MPSDAAFTAFVAGNHYKARDKKEPRRSFSVGQRVRVIAHPRLTGVVEEVDTLLCKVKIDGRDELLTYTPGDLEICP